MLKVTSEVTTLVSVATVSVIKVLAVEVTKELETWVTRLVPVVTTLVAVAAVELTVTVTFPGATVWRLVEARVVVMTVV